MASFLIYKTSGMHSDGTQAWRYEINNLGSVSVVLDQPISPMALPQEDATENVLVKMEGNTQTITVNWKIGQDFPYPKKSNTANVGISQIQSDFEKFFDSSAPASPITWTDLTYTEPEDTVAWLTNDFEGKDLSDRFILVLGHGSLRYEGFVTRMTCSIDGNSPVVWNASMTFIVGNVISIYETDAPSEPRAVSAELVDNNGATGGTNTRIKLAWQAPSDTATDITHYGLWVKEENKSYTSEPTLTVSVSNSNRSDELDGHVSAVAGEDSGYYEVSWGDPNATRTHFFNKDGSSYTVADWNLTSGKTYYFKIAAINVGGGSGFKSFEQTAVMP